MSKPTLLIVDDDPLIAESIEFFLREEFNIIAASSRAEAIDLLRSGHKPNLALVDLGLPPRPHRPDEGYQLIGDLLAHEPDIRIVVLSGQNEETNARHARALGAVDFIAKPAEPTVLRARLRQALVLPQASSGSILGHSLPMRRLNALIQQYADSPFPVLVTGESGSGKELVARELHFSSPRHEAPFLALNCAAISPSLVEATLFGHAKGAFTGAQQAKPGYFEDAQSGTLFLDEIGELPLELQPKLLRVLENGEYQRIGDTHTFTSSARIVAATNRDLRREVKEGRFRADLYHRLSVFSIVVPALRELGEDRVLLLEHFRHYYANASEVTPVELNATALDLWQRYTFPGNVRELRNIVIRLTAKYAGQKITAKELSEELDLAEQTHEQPLQTNHAPADGTAKLLAEAIENLENTGGVSLDLILQGWERAYIDAAQTLTSGNMTQAAKLLGVNRTTLYNRIVALERDKRNQSGNH